MNANNNSARPVRIRIDEVQVTGEGDTGGKDVYQLAALSEDYALFRKVDVRTDTARRLAPVDLPTA